MFFILPRYHSYKHACDAVADVPLRTIEKPVSVSSIREKGRPDGGCPATVAGTIESHVGYAKRSMQDDNN